MVVTTPVFHMTPSPKKTILITGASAGIGLATARYFAQQGWNVAATMRSPDKAGDLRDLPNVRVLRLDVLDVPSIEAALADTLRTFGGLDVLFNNAGYAIAGAFEAISPAQVQQQFATNVFRGAERDAGCAALLPGAQGRADSDYHLGGRPHRLPALQRLQQHQVGRGGLHGRLAV